MGICTLPEGLLWGFVQNELAPCGAFATFLKNDSCQTNAWQRSVGLELTEPLVSVFRIKEAGKQRINFEIIWECEKSTQVFLSERLIALERK